MDAAQLKAIQAPLKQKYKDDPASALVTFRAEGHVTTAMTCRLGTSGSLVEAGMHPAAGGSGSHASSGDLLLDALVACLGVTLRAVATSIGVELRDARVVAEGDLDFRGTLAVSKDVPVGFGEIRVRFELDTDASEEQRATLIRLTERYSVVLQTLRRPPTITVS